jgi:hypothetical protein
VVEKKGEIEKAFALDEKLSGRLDDSGEGTLGKSRLNFSIYVGLLHEPVSCRGQGDSCRSRFM